MKFSFKNAKPFGVQIYQQLEHVRNLGKNLITTYLSINHAVKKLCDAFHKVWDEEFFFPKPLGGTF
jgi:hypothetical protein